MIIIKRKSHLLHPTRTRMNKGPIKTKWFDKGYAEGDQSGYDRGFERGIKRSKAKGAFAIALAGAIGAAAIAGYFIGFDASTMAAAAGVGATTCGGLYLFVA
jgi:hypothetical protein